MWPYLRNTLAREPVTSTDTSREAHFKRKSPRGVAASAALLSGAIAALGAPVAPGVAAKTFSRAGSAGTRGLAVEGAMLGAQPQVPGAASRTSAGDLPLVSVMHSISDAHMPPLLHSDLHAHPPLVLSLNEAVLATMCRISPIVCAPLAPVAHTDEWSGRVAVSTGSVAANISRAGQSAANDTPSTLSSAAPLSMPVPDTGTYAGQMKGGLHGAWTAIGLPADLAAQLSRILAGRLDATRPAQADDYYRIVYEPIAGNRAGPSRRRVTAVEIRFAGRMYVLAHNLSRAVALLRALFTLLYAVLHGLHELAQCLPNRFPRIVGSRQQSHQRPGFNWAHGRNVLRQPLQGEDDVKRALRALLPE
jgi:hypothetical protein